MEPTEEELRAIAKRRVEARSGFLIHLAMYVATCAGLVIIWAFTGAGYPWFIWVVLGWGVAIVAHGMTLWLGPDSPRGEQAVRRELARLRRVEHPP